MHSGQTGGAVKVERQVVQDAAGNYVNHGLWSQFDEKGRLVARGEVLVGGTWIHQRGSDHLTYCFMAQPTDVSQFARTNGAAPTAVYEPAADPEDDATRRPKIRKNYQKNLFGTTI